MRRSGGFSLSALLRAIAAVALGAKPHYELVGRVVAIADGDTLTILDAEKTQHKIRLAGIDAPKKGQAFGTKSREKLASKVFGKDVRVEVIDGFDWRYVQYDRAGEYTEA